MVLLSNSKCGRDAMVPDLQVEVVARPPGVADGTDQVEGQRGLAQPGIQEGATERRRGCRRKVMRGSRCAVSVLKVCERESRTKGRHVWPCVEPASPEMALGNGLGFVGADVKGVFQVA